MKRLLLVGVIAAGFAAPAFAGPDPGPPPGQAAGSEFVAGTPANMYADLRDAARRCDKKNFDIIKFSISQSGKAASHFQTPQDLADWENWERIRKWQEKIRNWTYPCKESVGANPRSQGVIRPIDSAALQLYAGWNGAVGVGGVVSSGRTAYEGTGFSSSGDSGGVCGEGYIQRPFWNIPGAGVVNVGGMAAFCSGPNFSEINPGNGLPHKTKIDSYWLFGGRASIEQTWYAQAGVNRAWFRSTAVFGEFGAAISREKIIVPGLIGADTTSTQPFFGIGVSGVLPANVWGGGVAQNVDAAAIELYAAYRQFDAKATANFGGAEIPTKTEIQTVTMGARIRF